MNEPRWRARGRRLALQVESVDVLPTDLGSFLVRVAGSWEAGAERPQARPELVVEIEGEEQQIQSAVGYLKNRGVRVDEMQDSDTR
jgi:hypothetical protein